MPTQPLSSFSVRDYGSLVEGSNNTPEVIAQNTRTIQSTIDAAGQAGGGVVVLPAGTYQIAPSDLTLRHPASLFIRHDNVWLRGAGKSETILKSRGEFSLVDKDAATVCDLSTSATTRNTCRVLRGHGIYIAGTTLKAVPRTNVAIQDLTINGSLDGYTGNKSFPANVFTGDGWDVTHKGILLDFGRYVDDVLIDNVVVEDFRGELIYAGGMRVNHVTISNSTLQRANSSLLSMDGNLTVTNCIFKDSANAWVENAPITPDREYVITGCHFSNSDGSGLVLAQGRLPQGFSAKIFGNTFEKNLYGVCLFGGVSNVDIHDNTFTDVQRPLVFSGTNSNVAYYNNTVHGETIGSDLCQLSGILSGCTIHDNVVSNSTSITAPLTNCVRYSGTLSNVRIQGNQITNSLPPKQTGSLTEEAPFFASNSYIGIKPKTTSFGNSATSFVVTPECEIIDVLNNTAQSSLEISLNPDFYVDKQRVVLTCQSAKKLVLPAMALTVESEVQPGSDLLLGRGEAATLEYSADKDKWIVL